MTMAVPVQEFWIGQRVRRGSAPPFVIRVIYLTNNGYILYSVNDGHPYFKANELTLAPERPPYVPSERLIVLQDGGRPTFAFPEVISALYRCETDPEMLVRHSAEWDAYEAQGDWV